MATANTKNITVLLVKTAKITPRAGSTLIMMWPIALLFVDDVHTAPHDLH
jgi:hypothetical protein